jgi:hypothetical protein
LIGIALDSSNSVAISEFFELFKTPCERFRTGANYDVLISDQADVSTPDTRLVILICRNRDLACEGTELGSPGPRMLRIGEVTFPVYTGISRVTEGRPLVTIDRTGECVGSRLCENGIMVVYLGYDFFEETRYQLIYGQPVDFARFPTLDIHIANLRSWILDAGAPLIEIPPVPYGAKFFACLSHDVDFGGIRYHRCDRTMAGFVYRAFVKSVVRFLRGQYSLEMVAKNWIAVSKLPLIYLGVLKDIWATFGEYRAIEKGAKATFFFVPFKDKPGKTETGYAPSTRAVKYESGYARRVHTARSN